ncbi:endoglucanase C [Colletotrichum tofieldiae]|nr:endoglucanase C [Colletotrichum tofieldiae]
MPNGILRTSGSSIVDAQGKPVLLRGTALGGWMLMENFMNGFPGREHQIRAALLKVLGKEKCDFFFDKFLEYFFTEKDAEFLASIGFNCVRLSFNYHHFEDDMNPFVIKEEGFKHLDRAIEICAKYGIYTILDLHSAPGGQNQDWHSDNPTGYAAFWDHKHFQDRVINLWQVLAKRYAGNPWIAGYNPLNEPADMYDRKVTFMKEHNVPIWNGEFGPIYERKEYNPDWEEHNEERYKMLDKQMAIYTNEGIAWSIWAYKDVNVMGMTYLSPDSAWLKLLGPLIRKKRELAVDSWAYDDAHLQPNLFGPLHKWFEDNVPAEYNKKYPWQWRMHMHVFRGIRGITMAEYMIPEWADYFKDKTFEELDELAASWKYENCMQRQRLNDLLSLYAPMTPNDKRLEGKVIPSEVEKLEGKPKETVSGVGVFELAPDEKKRKLAHTNGTPIAVAS